MVERIEPVLVFLALSVVNRLQRLQMLVFVLLEFLLDLGNLGVGHHKGRLARDALDLACHKVPVYLCLLREI